MASFEGDQKKFYDIYAERFEQGRVFGRANRNHMKKIIKICELLNLSVNNKSDFRILEIGTGTGLHAKYIADHYVNIQYVGLDISEKMLHCAQDKFFSNPLNMGTFLVGDGNYLPFQPDSFDAAFISGSLHHFLDPIKGLKEMCRTVKPNGTMVIMEPNWIFPINFIEGCFNRIERNILKMNTHNFSAWASELGLTDIRIQNFLYTPPLSFIDPHFLDFIDKTLEKVPVLVSFSIMLYLSGKKGFPPVK